MAAMEFQLLFKGTADQSRFLTSKPAIPHVSAEGKASENGAASVEQEAEELLKQYCSFPVLRHAGQAALEAQSRAWLANLYRRLPADLVQKLLDTRLDTLGCVFFPQSSDESRAIALIKLTHWFFILDDVVDDPHLLGHDYDAARRFVLRVFKGMFGDSIKEAQAMGLIGENGYDELPEACGKAEEGMSNGDHDQDYKQQELHGASLAMVQQELVIEIGRQWASEMMANGLSVRQVERLREGVAQYLLGVITVVQLRQEKRLPSLEEYVHIRRMDGAEKLGFLACEFDVGIELDDQTLQHPLIQALQTATLNQMLWINDLLSFYREVYNDDYVSLLAVLHYNNLVEEGGSAGWKPPVDHHHNIADFQKALVQSRAMIKACDDDSLRLARDIATWRPELCRYVDSTLFIVSGLGFWTLWSSRYHTRGVLI